jgi:hypothetical protein
MTFLEVALMFRIWEIRIYWEFVAWHLMLCGSKYSNVYQTRENRVLYAALR